MKSVIRGAVDGVDVAEDDVVVFVFVELARLEMELLLCDDGNGCTSCCGGLFDGDVANGEVEITRSSDVVAANALRLFELCELTTLLGLKAFRSSLIRRRLSEI